MDFSGLLSFWIILGCCIIHTILCQNVNKRCQLLCHGVRIENKEIGFSIHITAKYIHMHYDLQLQYNSSCIHQKKIMKKYHYLNTTDAITIEWIAVRNMEIAESNKNMTNGTKDFKFYKSIKMNYSLFVVSILTSTEITCYSAAQEIAKCMYSSKLQQSCQLKEKMFGGIFKLMRFIYLQKDLDIQILEHFQQNDKLIGYIAAKSESITANVMFDHICIMNGHSNGTMANAFISDNIQPMVNIRAIITMCAYSFYQWEQNSLMRDGCNGGIINYTAQQKPSLVCILQSITVTAASASHLMNTFSEHNGGISYNVEHDSYQDMHFWHLFLVCISSNGAENFQIYTWKVNSTKDTVKFIFMNNQNLLDHEKSRFQFPDYARRHNISNGYLNYSFFKRKDKRRSKSSSLLVRLITKTYNLCNLHSIIIATDCSNVNERIMIDTNHVCLEQKQVHFVLSLSKPFMISICDSYSTFMILLLCFQEKLIMSGLSKKKDDNNALILNEIKMIQNKMHIIEVTQPLQVNIFSSSSYLLDQYTKTSLLFISPVSLIAISSYKLKCYQKQFWFDQISIGVLSTVISIPKTGSLQLDQIYILSNLTGYISNSSLFDVNKTKEKNKGLQSNNSHMVSFYLLSAQNYMPMNCYAVAFKQYFVILTKNCVNDTLNMWNTSSVNFMNNHTGLLNKLYLAYKSSFEMCMSNKFSMYFGSVTNRTSINHMHMLLLTSIKNDQIKHRTMKQPSQIFISADHAESYSSKIYSLCINHLFNILNKTFLISLFLIALLLPITFLSRLFFEWAKAFSHLLHSLSDKLDQTLWPWGIIRFLYIFISKICLLLAVYFEQEIVSHFYEMKAYAKTIPCVDHKNKSSFNRNCYFSDLAQRIYKAVNVPKETQAIKYTDGITCYSDHSSQCNVTKIEAVSNFHPPSISANITNYSAEAISFETNPDTVQPLDYQYSTELDSRSLVSVQEAKPECISSQIIDCNINCKYLTIPPHPIASCKVTTTYFANRSVHLYKNHLCNLQQSMQSEKEQNPEVVSKFHCKNACSSPVNNAVRKPLICRIFGSILYVNINLKFLIGINIFTALLFGIQKSIGDIVKITKCQIDLKLQDCEWKNVNEYLLLVKYKLLNYELSEIINYERIHSDLQPLNLSDIFLDYNPYELFGYILCAFCALVPLINYMLWECTNPKCPKVLLNAFQIVLNSKTTYISHSIKRTSSYPSLLDSTERSIHNKKTKQELNLNLHGSNHTEASGLLGSSQPPIAKSATNLEPSKSSKDYLKAVDTTAYSTSRLPGATASHDLQYETNFGENIPISREETRKNVRPVPKEKDVDSLIQSYQKNQITATATGNISSHFVQDKVNPPAQTVPSSSVNKPHKSLPRRACLVHHKEQYHLDNNLLSQPKATKYLVKVRTEISPGRFMAKLELQCSSKDDRLPNLDATQQVADTENNEQPDISNRERKHFPANISKIGHVIFTSNLDCFSGSIQYPLPNKKAAASRLGYGGNAIVFVVFHAGKEFAVKKTVYRSKEISVHSQLCHPNIINLEAVLIGEKHERHKDKHYVYCFMSKMDINFRNVLSTKEHGCLKHMKMQLLEKREQWEVVLVNVKHVLKSVLKALDYMHSQGLVHRDIKASNILIKMTCQCIEVLYCSCQRRKFLVQIGDFDSSATVPGYQLRIEEHQMIRYASVLPLGTMGYRAPEVSMHLVLSGPYEVLYTTSVDIWSFGCLLLTIFIGKSGPLKQRGEASLLLSAQDYPYSQDLYQQIIKIKEVQKYYANTPGVCDLVHKCLQVQPHCRPTAKELLQLDFFTDVV